ncbi:MAG: regulatory iron-sulfur-containing complex subunit RicT [Eggerthellaceae bacterium]|nr:regulatory iron-sulfur-containing complex subunit RicT [Eggerthellaceae bacterium]
MVRIAPIRLSHSSATLWFDALDLELSKDMAVVVLTARGVEFGHLADEVFEATEEQVAQLKSPLKPVKRIATEEDIEQAARMEALGEEALPIFREMAAETNEDMHPVSVEYLFEGDKAVFYFEADDRVDFRELVRKLASHFRVRVDMRQIGVRDEARLIGGLGHCGQELCCKRLGGEFNPVSIRMAKEQDLSLNPQKISGLCGRLMCCLRYEYDAYKEFKSRAPKQNATIQTPEGPAKVTNLDVPREIVTLKLEDDKTIKIPLDEFDPPKEGATRPCCVCQEAWDRAKEAASMGVMAKTVFLTSQFTQDVKIGDAVAVRHEPSAKPMPSKKQPAKRQKTQDSAPTEHATTKLRKRRRSTKVATSTTEQAVEQTAGRTEKAKAQEDAGAQAPRKRRRGNRPTGASRPEAQQSRDESTKQAKTGPRPGQKSSGVRQSQNAMRKSKENTPTDEKQQSSQKKGRSRRRGGVVRKDADTAKPASATQAKQGEPSASSKDSSRKPRRRFRKRREGSGGTQTGE